MASRKYRHKLIDGRECSICLQKCAKPRSLPGCSHSYCLQCLKDLVQKSEQLEGMKCPDCRKEFTISRRSFIEWPGKIIHEQLLDGVNFVSAEKYHRILDPISQGNSKHPDHFSTTSRTASKHHDLLPCRLCTDNSIATMFCLDCDIDICTFCTASHKEAPSSKSHNLVVNCKAAAIDVESQPVLALEDAECLTTFGGEIIVAKLCQMCPANYRCEATSYCIDCDKYACLTCSATDGPAFSAPLQKKTDLNEKDPDEKSVSDEPEERNTKSGAEDQPKNEPEVEKQKSRPEEHNDYMDDKDETGFLEAQLLSEDMVAVHDQWNRGDEIVYDFSRVSEDDLERLLDYLDRQDWALQYFDGNDAFYVAIDESILGLSEAKTKIETTGIGPIGFLPIKLIKPCPTEQVLTMQKGDGIDVTKPYQPTAIVDHLPCSHSNEEFEEEHGDEDEDNESPACSTHQPVLLPNANIHCIHNNMQRTALFGGVISVNGPHFSSKFGLCPGHLFEKIPDKMRSISIICSNAECQGHYIGDCCRVLEEGGAAEEGRRILKDLALISLHDSCKAQNIIHLENQNEYGLGLSRDHIKRGTEIFFLDQNGIRKTGKIYNANYTDKTCNPQIFRALAITCSQGLTHIQCKGDSGALVIMKPEQENAKMLKILGLVLSFVKAKDVRRKYDALNLNHQERLQSRLVDVCYPPNSSSPQTDASPQCTPCPKAIPGQNNMPIPQDTLQRHDTPIVQEGSVLEHPPSPQHEHSPKNTPKIKSSKNTPSPQDIPHTEYPPIPPDTPSPQDTPETEYPPFPQDTPSPKDTPSPQDTPRLKDTPSQQYLYSPEDVSYKQHVLKLPVQTSPQKTPSQVTSEHFHALKVPGSHRPKTVTIANRLSKVLDCEFKGCNIEFTDDLSAETNQLANSACSAIILQSTMCLVCTAVTNQPAQSACSVNNEPAIGASSAVSQS